MCERMNHRFSKGPHALRLATILISVRGQILAAEARLSLLSRKLTGASEIW